MLALTDTDLSRLHTYMKASYGIDLSKKKQLTVSRLSNMLASHGYRSFSEYVGEILTGRNKEMVTSILNKLTTNYTYFLHEKAHFQSLQNTVLPDLAKKHARDKTLPTWSAGYSSGEKPYTVPMYLREFFRSQTDSWDTWILATDVSQQTLSKIRNPVYWEESLECLSSFWKQKYFAKDKDNTYTIAPATKQNVISRTFDLMNPIRFHRLFDLILCRSAMIYFDQTTEDALVQRLYDATVPGTYLLTGHSESLNKTACPYEYLMPAIYRETRHRFV